MLQFCWMIPIEVEDTYVYIHFIYICGWASKGWICLWCKWSMFTRNKKILNQILLYPPSTNQKCCYQWIKCWIDVLCVECGRFHFGFGVLLPKNVCSIRHNSKKNWLIFIQKKNESKKKIEKKRRKCVFFFSFVYVPNCVYR